MALVGVAFIGSVEAQSTRHEQRSYLSLGSATDNHAVYDSFAPYDRELQVPGVGSARARSRLAFGENSVTAKMAVDGPVTRATAQAINSWADAIKIDAPGLTGTWGRFTAKISVKGFASFDYSGAYANSGSANVSGFWNSLFFASYDGGNGWFENGLSGSWQRDSSNFSNITYTGQSLDGFTMEIGAPFMYGEEFLIAGYLETAIIAENPDLIPASITATVDFSPGAKWQGVSGIYDENDNLVSNATVWSRSGTNYMQPVPEPTTLAGAALGVAALLRRRRRKA